MIPRAGSPARASACAGGLSDARLALFLGRGVVVDRMTVVSTSPVREEASVCSLRVSVAATRCPIQGRTRAGTVASGRRESAEVQRPQWRIRRGVPRGERRQVPFLLEKQVEDDLVLPRLAAARRGPALLDVLGEPPPPLG